MTGGWTGEDVSGAARGPGERRRVFTIAVADYQDNDVNFAKAVEKQLDVLDAWWRDPRLPGGAFEVERAAPLRSRRDVEDFLHRSELREAGPEDVLLLLVTGHGGTAASGRHYLFLPESQPSRTMATAFPTAEIAAAALDSRAGHVLVIVNACDSGGIQPELAALRRDLSPLRRRDGVLAVLATSDFDQTVPVGAFGVLLERLHQRLCTVSEFAGEHLSLEAFLTEMNAVLQIYGSDQFTPLFNVLAENGGEPHRALPNPGYRPPEDLVEPQSRQLAVARAEMDYWISRASGADGFDGGWYFSGRRALNHRLAGFLADGPASGYASTLIVTGTAGSGKSAVLARAVTFADPAFRADDRYRAAVELAPAETVPPPGSVHAAILARNRTSSQILASLLRALGRSIPEPTPGTDLVRVLLAEVGAAVTAAAEPVTVVIDGLDEADNPYLLTSQVIAPLARLQPPPRLVIGVRSARNVAPAGPDGGRVLEHGRLIRLLRRATTVDGRGPVVQRTDGEGTAADIVEYVQTLLEGTPVGGRATAEALWACLPDEASFLEAQFASRQLLGAVDPLRLFNDAAWRAGLRIGTVGLLRQDLAAAGSNPRPDIALALLRASAFALGAGVPRAVVWPAIAEAVANEPIPDPDAAISALLSGRLSGYLLTDVDAGRVVYRPLHEDLARVLREEPHLLRVSTEQP